MHRQTDRQTHTQTDSSVPVGLLPLSQELSLELIHLGVSLSALSSSLGQIVIHYLPHILHLALHLMSHGCSLNPIAQCLVNLCQLMRCICLCAHHIAASGRATCKVLAVLEFGDFGLGNE